MAGEANAAASTGKTVTLKKDKECKHSVRYATAEVGVVCDNLYLNRTFAEKMPDEITVTIAAK